jgi:hypothetical protein
VESARKILFSIRNDSDEDVSLKDFIKIFKTDELGEKFVKIINNEI